MEFNVDLEKRLLRCISSGRSSYDHVKSYFNKVVEGSYFSGRAVRANIFKYNTLPIGLIGELKNCCQKHNIKLKINGEENLRGKLSKKWFTEWVNEFFKHSPKIKPYYYQIDAAYEVLCNKRCLLSIATRGGKTLIAFIVFSFLLSHKSSVKILMVVPTINLVSQAISDFYEYYHMCRQYDKYSLNAVGIFGGLDEKKIHKNNIIVSTYQSLAKKAVPKIKRRKNPNYDPNFFKQFGVCMIDEVHTAKAYTVMQILQHCFNAGFVFGVSGTIPLPETLDRFNIMMYTGRIVFTKTARELMDEGFITGVFIQVNRLFHSNVHSLNDNYARLIDASSKNGISGNTKADIETRQMHGSLKRLRMIKDKCQSYNNNTIVLFRYRLYGDLLYNMLKTKLDGKRVYYVDGDTDNSVRNYIKESTVDNDNVIIVASFKTFGTGLTMSNLHNVVFAEAYKDHKIIVQSIGRALGKHETKTTALVEDFADYFVPSPELLSKKKNHSTLGTWLEKRVEAYDREDYPYEIIDHIL